MQYHQDEWKVEGAGGMSKREVKAKKDFDNRQNKIKKAQRKIQRKADLNDEDVCFQI